MRNINKKLTKENLKSIDDIVKIFDNIEILKQLARTWMAFSDFRLTCTKLHETEELLSILSILSSVAELKNMEAFNYISRDNKETLPEFKTFNELWSSDYNASILKKIFINFGFNSIEIDNEYNDFLSIIKNIELDPILKFVVILLYTCKYTKDNKILVRIASIFIFKYLNIMNIPILYPLEFLSIEREYTFIDEKSSIVTLKTFENICKFGEYTINLVDSSISQLQQEMKKNKELKKFSSSKYFYNVFSKPYIKITEFMKEGNFKRDKAARLLARLVKRGYLKEQKSGKEKIFINLQMIIFLEKADVSKSIKNYIV